MPGRLEVYIPGKVTKLPAGKRAGAPAAGPAHRRERALVVVLCIAAALRVFFFCAVCPLFNNVDEQAHFDLVLKYSHGHVPSTGLENYGREAAELIVLCGSPEYLTARSGNVEPPPPPPPWTYPSVRDMPEFQRVASAWTTLTNHEAASFPVYYAVAGAWCAAGRTFGLRDGRLAYWIRFLDVPLIALLVWVSHLVGATFFAQRQTLRLGLPLLAAFHPQDIFHSINSDALSPVLFAAAFLLALWPGRRSRGTGWQAMTGLAVAATFLVKPSNIAILVVLAIAIFQDCRIAARAGELGRALRSTGALLAAAAVTIGAWLVRNWILMGSLTGAGAKVKFLTWTLKPIGAWWHHPLFSVRGVEIFLGEITRTFWRGEIVWYRQVLAHKGMDTFYVVSSAVLLLVSLTALMITRKKEPEGSRVVALCFVAVAISLLFMANVSIAYDFGRCPSPSRQMPFLLSGRLISGVLVPFLVLYLDGLDRLLAPVRSRVNPVFAVAAVAVAITCSELLLVRPMLQSQYNWFHL